MTDHSPMYRWRCGSPRRRSVAALCCGVVASVMWGGTAAAQTEDPSLDQQVDAEQVTATDNAVLSTGHVDVGPRFVDGEWTLMVHDDTTTPSVWRELSRTVLQIRDTALAAIPDDPDYAFLGVEPGAQVHVVPQTQDPEVVWVGWNTQDPEVMERIDRGATLSLLGVEGPGTMTMYLQSGNFGAPDVLWDSTLADRQSVWVDVNTHTHANWVFSAPGVYLVQVEVSAELIDGSTVSDVEELRFAIGDSTSTGDALTAEYSTPPPAAEDEQTAPAGRGDDDEGAGSTGLVIGIAAVAVLLGVGVVVVVVRGARIKDRAEQERLARTSGQGTNGPRA